MNQLIDSLKKTFLTMTGIMPTPSKEKLKNGFLVKITLGKKEIEVCANNELLEYFSKKVLLDPTPSEESKRDLLMEIANLIVGGAKIKNTTIEDMGLPIFFGLSELNTHKQECFRIENGLCAIRSEDE